MAALQQVTSGKHFLKNGICSFTVLDDSPIPFCTFPSIYAAIILLLHSFLNLSIEQRTVFVNYYFRVTEQLRDENMVVGGEWCVVGEN